MYVCSIIIIFVPHYEYEIKKICNKKLQLLFIQEIVKNMEESEITNVFRDIVSRSRSMDMAQRDFRRMMDEDPDLRKQYKQWCSEMGYAEKEGFAIFCYEYIDEMAGMWDIFDDNDDR